MKFLKLSPALVTGILLALFIGISLFLRIYLPYKEIFVGGWVKFSSNDAYYYMRIVDSLAKNFPHLSQFDPYLIYPEGARVGSIIFFGWLIAGVAWVAGLGSPSQQVIDVVGAYFPAIMAALTIIPVYVIGKTLFGRWAGIIGAALITIMPGEFLGRSILAFTDHHIAESLFTAVTMMFLVLAIKSGQSQFTFERLLQRDWPACRRTLVYCALAGLFLGIYMITWLGASLFVLIITFYLVLQYIIDHLKGRPTDYLAALGFIPFLIALVIVAPFSPGTAIITGLAIAMLLPPALSALSRYMAARQMRRGYYPLAVLGLGVVAIALLRLAVPSSFGYMLSQFTILFFPSGASMTTLEMQHLLFPNGTFSWGLAWGNFTTGFFGAIAALLILMYVTIRRGDSGKTLMLVWSLVILAATLSQRRFAYYLAVNVALLTGYVCWQLIWVSGVKKLQEMKATEAVIAADKQGKPKRKRKVQGGITSNHVNAALALIVVLVLAFPFNIKPAIQTAGDARFAPSDAWCSALTWLKDNSPDPFGNPDDYYRLYDIPKPGQTFQYPKTAYGVAAWWDYGYWITRIAHRMPSTNPSQDPGPIIKLTGLFLAQDEAAAVKPLQELASRYIVIDNSTSTAKFWAIVTWANRPQSDFFDDYYIPQQKITARVYYPEYYMALSTRLYNFDAKAVTPKSSIVIGWEDKVASNGTRYKEVISGQSFTDYKEAMTYLQAQKSGKFRLVGANPFISPIPLEALKDYKLAYSSPNTVSQGEAGPVPEVKVFEYTGSALGPK